MTEACGLPVPEAGSLRSRCRQAGSRGGPSQGWGVRSSASPAPGAPPTASEAPWLVAEASPRPRPSSSPGLLPVFPPASKCPPFISFLHLLFWTRWVFFAARELSAVAERGAHPLVVVRGFSRGGARALGGRASFSGSGARAVAHRLRCSVACGIFSEQGPNPCALHWQVGSPPLEHRRSPSSPSWKGPSHVELGPTRMTAS